MRITDTTNPVQQLFDLLKAESADYLNHKLFDDSLKEFMIPKGRVVVDVGQTSKCLYFIKRGAMRAYMLRGSEDVTSLLVSDGDVICIAESFLFQKPSTEVLETLEDTRGFSMSYEAYRKLVTADVKIASLAIQFLEQHLVSFSDRLKTFKCLSVEQRIAHYLNQPSSLFRRIPDHYIATYLGTTPATFSRCLKSINIDRQIVNRVLCLTLFATDLPSFL